ncbi:MAG: 4-hydroxythreonine-4-phosphate dehydrogenase PdxA [Planctomycetes bacterium]|nr:4-hydroxythreonine-4-phosphate dehydrogenase PdxA [Planctomycetota bacterium]
MSAQTHFPTLAVPVGDPAGIGPEVVTAAMGKMEVRAAAKLLAIGPGSLRPDSVPLIVDPEEAGRHPSSWLATDGPKEWRMGEASAVCGAAAIASLRAGHELALSGAVDGLVTGPVCKQAFHMAGERVEGQTELLARWCGVERYGMLAMAGELRVLLLSRHQPLREAIANITRASVLEHLHLLNTTLCDLGVKAPRLALPGLNPHAGEAGLLGEEERELLVPALALARERGLDVTGPLSPDVVFRDAAAGRYDGVLALYHDQAFLPIKILGETSGCTLAAGLPYLRMSPVHGTAFDIAGAGVASCENLVATIRSAAALCESRAKVALS